MQTVRLMVVATAMALVTTAVLGLGYPLLVTGLAQVLFPRQANGLDRTGRLVGGDLVGQPFASPGYFWSRPSAAGHGYDAARSGGSNLGPTNRTLIARVRTDLARVQPTNPGAGVPVDLVTASGSGLDPHITPAAAEFQVPRVARVRGMEEVALRKLVLGETEGRQAGVLGEPRVNVLRLNRLLDERYPLRARSTGVNR